MGIGTSIFLIALGAILDFAVDATLPGISIHAVGVILMLVGVIGAIASLFFWDSWGGFGRTVVRSRSYAAPVSRPVYTTPVAATPVAPVVGQQVVGQPVVGQPVVGQPVYGSPGVVQQPVRRVVEEETY